MARDSHPSTPCARGSAGAVTDAVSAGTGVQAASCLAAVEFVRKLAAIQAAFRGDSFGVGPSGTPVCRYAGNL